LLSSPVVLGSADRKNLRAPGLRSGLRLKGLTGQSPVNKPISARREDGSQPDLAFFTISKAVRYRHGDVIAFINARRAVSKLAAREMKSIPASARADDSRSRELQNAGDKAKRKKADPGIDGQTSLF
jgi:hypothetical protein